MPIEDIGGVSPNLHFEPLIECKSLGEGNVLVNDSASADAGQGGRHCSQCECGRVRESVDVEITGIRISRVVVRATGVTANLLTGNRIWPDDKSSDPDAGTHPDRSPSMIVLNRGKCPTAHGRVQNSIGASQKPLTLTNRQLITVTDVQHLRSVSTNTGLERLW